MRNCAGRRLSFFFSSAYSALHQSNISLFLLFLFFHSFPLSLSPVTSIPSRRELSFSNAFRASFAHLPGRERGRTSRIVNARGRSATRSARIVRRQETVVRYESKAVRAAEKRIRQRRSSSNYTRPPFENEGKTNNFHTRDYIRPCVNFINFRFLGTIDSIIPSFKKYLEY